MWLPVINIWHIKTLYKRKAHPPLVCLHRDFKQSNFLEFFFLHSSFLGNGLLPCSPSRDSVGIPSLVYLAVGFHFWIIVISVREVGPATAMTTHLPFFPWATLDEAVWVCKVLTVCVVRVIFNKCQRNSVFLFCIVAISEMTPLVMPHWSFFFFILFHSIGY